VPLLDIAITRGYLREEVAAAERWATRHGIALAYDDACLTVRVEMQGSSAEGSSPERYLVVGQFDDYRLLPPAWQFVDHRTGMAIGLPAYPKPDGGSVLHGNGLVCAPWNRLAYKNLGGPHDNWDISKWQDVKDGTRADYVADMLARLLHETRSSRGRNGVLPPMSL
jgi:hypothetical protein